MKKISLALALGTGLTLGLAARSAHADAISPKSLTPTTIAASDFSNLFDTSNPVTGIQSSPFQFSDAPASGIVQSQVFKGIGSDAGQYAYAYQVGVNNVATSDGSPVQVNSASWRFNAIPTSSLVVSGGPVGNLTLPPAGETPQAPSQLNFATETGSGGSTLGSLTAQFLDTKAPSSGPLEAGKNSAIFVVLSEQPPTTPTGSTVLKPVNVNGPDPVVGGPTVYVPGSATISPVPAPEPTTVLAWAGVLGGVALVRRVRKNRVVIA
jgi:hypothetical protein